MCKSKYANRIFELCLFTIILVTAVDVFWSVHTGPTLLEFEQNPLAVYIIEWGNANHINGIGLLCAFKVLNTYIVVRACQWLLKMKPAWGWGATVGVTFFQLFVIWYLYYGGDQG
tara:strand:- start:440 stop:784 length:345 start_codon:yes stop_codon:yes gene_type:complete